MLFVLFHLGSDRYALAAREVAEVLPLVALKELPGAPRGVAGLMDYRGAPLPVIDLNALAFARPAARRVSTRILVVHYAPRAGRPRLLGLLAERATEMLRRAPADFQPAGVHSEKTRYPGPVVTDPQGLIQRIELAELLDDALRRVLFPVEEAATA